MTERPWELGFGPIMIQPGEIKKVDVQPKCRFTGEKIRSATECNTDVHLLGLYVGPTEILKLNGDSIDLGSKETTLIESKHETHPAFTMEVEIANRGKTERKVYLDILGQAVL